MSQSRDTIQINNTQYVVTIDTINHTILDVEEFDDNSFMDNIYFGFDIMPIEGNFEPKILYDITDYSKIGIGYNLGHKTISIGAYISLGKARKSKSIYKPIYF